MVQPIGRCLPKAKIAGSSPAGSAARFSLAQATAGQADGDGGTSSLCFPFRLAVLAECHLNAALLGAAQDVQLDGVAGRPERAGQVVDGADWLACGRYDQVAGGQASTRGWAVFGYIADEQALDVGEADGASQPPGHMAGSDRDTKLWRLYRFSAAERVDPAAQCLVGGYGQVEAFAEAVRIDPEQLPGRIKNRAARGAGQQRSGVLEAAGDAQATRAAEGPVDAGDEAERHPQSAPARVSQREDGHPDGGRFGGPRQCRSLTGVDLDDGEIAVDVVPRHVPLGRAPVGEGDRHLTAAYVVRVGEHLPRAEHDARADAPPLPDAHHRGAGVLRQPRDVGLNLVEDRHRRPSLQLVVICKLLLTTTGMSTRRLRFFYGPERNCLLTAGRGAGQGGRPVDPAGGGGAAHWAAPVQRSARPDPRYRGEHLVRAPQAARA